MNNGITYNIGDIVLIKFPFTNLINYKKRPVLIINITDYNDIVCFQITSNPNQTNIIEIKNTNLDDTSFKYKSYIKYDKCFTIDANLIEKRIGKVNQAFLLEIKEAFCENSFKL